MAESQRRGGLITVRQNGIAQFARGKWSYNLGKPKREAILGADKVHGFMEKPQVAFIEGEITDRLSMDLAKLVTGEGLTITLELANGKTIVLTEAWFAADGKVEAEEGNVAVRFEGASAEEF